LINNYKHFCKVQYSSLSTPYKYVKSSEGIAIAILNIDTRQKRVTGCKAWQLCVRPKAWVFQGQLARQAPEDVSTIWRKTYCSYRESRDDPSIVEPVIQFVCVCTDSLKKNTCNVFIWKKKIIRDKRINNRAVRKEEMGTCLVK
jgi:hypothetical protein